MKFHWWVLSDFVPYLPISSLFIHSLHHFPPQVWLFFHPRKHWYLSFFYEHRNTLSHYKIQLSLATLETLEAILLSKRQRNWRRVISICTQMSQVTSLLEQEEITSWKTQNVKVGETVLNSKWNEMISSYEILRRK